MNITLDEVFLILFVWIDDWHQENIVKASRSGRPVDMSDSEILTLMLVMDFIEFESERHYLEFIRSHYLELFPSLLDHSQYNRRVRALGSMLEELRERLCLELEINKENNFIVDTTPVVAVGYKRDKSHSDFAGSADYGYCAARQLQYFGYKLVMLVSLDGIPGPIELVPANTDERACADELLDKIPQGSNVLGDKGFVGKDWQEGWRKQGINLITFKRKNQIDQPDIETNKILSTVRERIEGVYKLLKTAGQSIEHTYAHTIEGLCTRVVTKITSLVAKLFLRKKWGIDILTFKQHLVEI